MPLTAFDQLNGTAPTPPVSERKKIAAQQVTQGSVQLVQQIISSLNQLHGCVWNAGQNFGLTPQQVVDALGDDAIPLFGLHATLKSVIEANVPQAAGKIAAVPEGYATDYSTGKLVITEAE